MEDIMMAIIWLGFFAAVFLGWYFYIQARNKERMSLIERGKDVSEIYSKREIKFNFPWLKLGIILTGFSFGWLVAFISTEILFTRNGFGHRVDGTPLIMGIIFLFTAVSIIVAYFVDKPKTKK